MNIVRFDTSLLEPRNQGGRKEFVSGTIILRLLNALEEDDYARHVNELSRGLIPHELAEPFKADAGQSDTYCTY